MKPAEAAEQFMISGGVQHVEIFGRGHIHKTFLVLSGNGDRYILQELNTFVFNRPSELMENALRIVRHLLKKVDEGVIDWEIMQFISLKKGGHLLSESGQYWRAFTFLPHEPPEYRGKELYQTAGKAYGLFNLLLSDMPGPLLHETIPHFHDMEYRLKQFDESLRIGNAERIKKAGPEIEFLTKYRERAMIVPNMIRQNTIPVRVTHNDTKIDNILFNRNREVVSVIDLDTVMPGVIHSDFGDAIRTFGNTSGEDERDISKVNIDLDAFYLFSKGFLGAIKSSLSVTEKESLVHAPSLFAYMQAVRFLTDYFLEDSYYRIKFRDHNLIRARNQVALFRSFIQNESEMTEILNSLYSD